MKENMFQICIFIKVTRNKYVEHLLASVSVKRSPFAMLREMFQLLKYLVPSKSIVYVIIKK